ncbi:unnamed protein product [Closterium sp. NIES-65]|nr:unnamed protein product [Closterium sp. NIES-65]
MADVDMTDARPSTDHSPTSTEEETLPLLYDLDKLTQIPEGEFTKDIPPPPIGDFNKKKKQNPTRNGRPGTSSAPAGSGNQVEVEEEEDGGEEEEEESDDENDERPPRSTSQRTLEERLRRELEYIDDLLEQDEDADQENLSVPREQWRAADFVEEDMVYATIDVLVLDALRHLQTVERNSTLRQYTSWIYHYKRWAAKMLMQIRNKLPQEYRLKRVDKIGHYIRDNKKKNWDQEADVPRSHVWLHGPRVTTSRLRAYVKYMAREMKLDAESSKEGDNATGTQPVQSTTVHTLLGRIKACQMAARVEATIYRETELSIMREISVVRSEVRFMIRTKNERDLKNCTDRRRGTIGDTYTAEQFRQIMCRVLPTWAAKAWNPRGTGPSQTLWRFLLLKVLTLLSHHSLLRGASIREITLPDIFLYRLASTSSVNPENQPVVMIGQFHGVRLIPPVDTSTRASWYKKHLFFTKNDTDQGELSAASHQRWTRQLWDKNGVFCKRNMHAARAGGAQELAIDGTPRAEIAELGHWALDKMTRAYITAIPVGVVMKKAGYSGYKQDYFLGRSRVEPSDKLLKLLAEHIFPGVDDMLKTAEGKAAEGSDADKAAVHFWRTLAMLRRIVAEDLAVKLVRTPWHRIAEPGFIDRHTLLAGATQGALNKRVRRMLKVIDAVRQLRASDGEADSEAVVDTLHRIAASGIGTFADALTVLKPGTAPMLSKEAGMGVKGLGPKVVSKLRLACALVALNLKQSDWVETLFPNTWEEQMPKTKADLAKPTAPAKSTAPAKPTAPVHRPPTKRKKSA